MPKHEQGNYLESMKYTELSSHPKVNEAREIIMQEAIRATFSKDKGLAKRGLLFITGIRSVK